MLRLNNPRCKLQQHKHERRKKERFTCLKKTCKPQLLLKDFIMCISLLWKQKLTK